MAGCNRGTGFKMKEPRGGEIRGTSKGCSTAAPSVESPFSGFFSSKTLVASGLGYQKETHYLTSLP